MGRPATGAVKWNAALSRWEVRVTLANRERKKVAMAGLAACLTEPSAPARGCPCASCEAARAKALEVNAYVRAKGVVPLGAGKTVSEWFEDWLAARVAKGLRSTANDRTRYTKWIAPVIGMRPIAAVERRDVERVVQLLDEAVASKRLSSKTARNVFGVLTKMFSDACRSKVLELRAREDNPARDVAGPDRGIERSGPYLFPAEFLAVMRCSRVPPRWKRLVALGSYLGVRRGELAALEWGDVSLDRRFVHVHRAEDESGNVKSTKTGDTRKVPIEPTLAPLLERMREHANGEGRVVTAMPPREEMASRLRRYVEWACAEAGLELREELTANDETRRPLVWHDLRHGYATWRLVRGDNPKRVQRAGGWETASMLDRYANEAETFEDGGTFGEPFPPLPVGALLAVEGAGSARGGFRSSFGFLARAEGQKPGKTGLSWRPQGDSNPC